jgi:hypothetical protein
MQPDGSYRQRRAPSSGEQIGLHQFLIAATERAAKEARRLKKRMARVKLRR